MGEMVVSTSNNILTVFHTEVTPAAEGMGIGKLLLQKMVEHATKNHLKVTPLCVFVLAQFKRHPQQYVAVWQPAQPS